jgi:hypothetical protein
LTKHFTGAGYDGKAIRLAVQDGGGLCAKQGEKGHLITVGHVYVPVTPNIIQELVHGRDGGLANQPEGGLIKVNAFCEAAILRTI